MKPVRGMQKELREDVTQATLDSRRRQLREARRRGVDPGNMRDEVRNLIDVLVQIRMEQGITQRDMAMLMGLGKSQSMVSEFENYLVDVRMSTLFRYAETLGVRLIITIDRTRIRMDIADALELQLDVGVRPDSRLRHR